MRIRTRRLCGNRATVQIGAATNMMDGDWRAMAQFCDRRTIVIGVELVSHRRAVEGHHHEAQGHNSDQAVNCFQNRHGGAIPFAFKRAFQKNVPYPVGRGKSESESCRCAQGCRREYEIAASLWASS